MVAFSERSLCYQVGLLLLLVATPVFAVGLALPWWAQTHSQATGLVTRHTGLWVGCSTVPVPQCSPIDAPAWFKAVQGLQCVALMGMLLACLYALFANCCLDHATSSRTVEISAGTGGLLGIVSTMVYVAKTSHILRQHHDVSYSWAFGINVAACVFVTFIAAVIALANNRHGDVDAGFVLEECGSDSGRGYRSRLRKMGGRREGGEERRSVTTGGLGSSPRYTAEVIVLQNKCAADPQRFAVKVTGSADAAVCSTPCGCPQWKDSTCNTTGHCRGGGSCHGHGQCLTRTDCCPAHHSTAPNCCISPPMGAPPAVHHHSTCPHARDPPPGSVPPPYVGTCCSGPASAHPHPSTVSTEPPATCPHDCTTAEHGTTEKAHTDFEHYPREVATAPPLSAEFGEHTDYATAQYFVTSETVCMNEGQRREQ